MLNEAMQIALVAGGLIIVMILLRILAYVHKQADSVRNIEKHIKLQDKVDKEDRK